MTRVKADDLEVRPQAEREGGGGRKTEARGDKLECERVKESQPVQTAVAFWPKKILSEKKI